MCKLENGEEREARSVILAHSFRRARQDQDGRAMILNLFVHTAHHRAQSEVYLRAKGVKPPDDTF